LIDEEMQEMMQPDLPEGVKVVFISAVAETGLMPLKDLLWTTINAE
jgi:GTPase